MTWSSPGLSCQAPTLCLLLLLPIVHRNTSRRRQNRVHQRQQRAGDAVKEETETEIGLGVASVSGNATSCAISEAFSITLEGGGSQDVGPQATSSRMEVEPPSPFEN